jgi:transposase
MNSRRYKSDINKLLEEGKEIMTASEDSKYLMRVFAVNMVLSGYEVSKISEMAGVSGATIYKWIKIVDEEGFEALRNKKIPGRPSRLNDKQLTALDLAIQSNPNDYGFKTWDGPSLSEYIKNTFKVNIGVRRCQELFHKLGFSHIRPQTFPSKGYEDTEERTSFKKNQ